MSSPALALEILLVLTGPVFGSFIAAFAMRWPAGQNILIGRSACPECGLRLGLRDLVPIVSWFLLGRRCRRCDAPISSFYPLIEATGLAIAMVVVWCVDGVVDQLLALGLGYWLLALSAVDVRVMRLPDFLTLPLVVVGLAVTWWQSPDQFWAHTVAAVAGYAALALVALLYLRLRGRSGLGMGDAKLMAGLGAWLGPFGLAPALLIASVSGLIFAGLLFFVSRVDVREIKIPFGPFLSLGAFSIYIFS